MAFTTRTATINTAALATQTLPEEAVQVLAIVGLAGGATAIAATTYTVQSTAPASATEVEFTGSANAPSETLTFDAALTANGVLFVTYVPVGAVPASL